MNRLQKKCVVASTGMHLLLVAVVFIGPAFSRTKPGEDIREIDFVPTILVDANVAGGGNPNARPPAPVATPQPQPQPPAPQPKPAAPPPEPKKLPEPDKSTEPDPNSFAETKKPRKPHIVTTPTTRPKEKTAPKPSTDTQAQEQKQLADARRKAGQELIRAAGDIRQGTSSATAIDEDFGPGGGGPAYAGFASWVQKIYQDAWIAPEDTASDASVTKARVTIANDGHVISSEIIDRSGDRQMDSSVQRTLDRVTTVGRPFPEGVKDKQRSYILKFDLKVKRGLA